MANITITALTEVDELLCHYPGQTSPQDCFLELDPKEGTVRCGYSGEVGNAVPVAVYNRRILRWRIPVLRDTAANRLMADLVPLFVRIVDGYDTEWNGSDTVGVLDEDAQKAMDAVIVACDTDWPETAIVQVSDAADWYAALGSRTAQAAHLGITSETTDDQLAAIVETEETAAKNWATPVILREVSKYLESLRDDACA